MYSGTADGTALRRAVFIDRDGTLNVEKDYLYLPEEFAFIPGVPEAIRRLRQAGFLVVVVTNQSGVARGYFTAQDVEYLHRHIQVELSSYETAVDAFYYCPHHPEAGESSCRRSCDCRKPRPGMLLQAARDLGIDLTRSYMIGDKCVDLDAGMAAGCKSILVLTGYGVQERDQADPATPCHVNLLAAVEAILSGDN